MLQLAILDYVAIRDTELCFKLRYWVMLQFAILGYVIIDYAELCCNLRYWVLCNLQYWVLLQLALLGYVEIRNTWLYCNVPRCVMLQLAILFYIAIGDTGSMLQLEINWRSIGDTGNVAICFTGLCCNWRYWFVLKFVILGNV